MTVKTHSNAHAPCARDQPAPHGRCGASGFERVDEGSHDGGEEPTNADCKGERRQVAELALEDGLVAKLCSKLGILVGQFVEVDPSRAVGAVHLDDADALLSLADFGADMLS